MSHKMITSIVCPLLLLVGCAQTESNTLDLASLIKQGGLVVDVRTMQEYDAGHYPDAINIPYDEMPESLHLLGDDQDQAIILYCRTGRRSAIAHEILEQAGYTNVHSVANQDLLPQPE